MWDMSRWWKHTLCCGNGRRPLTHFRLWWSDWLLWKPYMSKVSIFLPPPSFLLQIFLLLLLLLFLLVFSFTGTIMFFFAASSFLQLQQQVEDLQQQLLVKVSVMEGNIKLVRHCLLITGKRPNKIPKKFQFDFSRKRILWWFFWTKFQNSNDSTILCDFFLDKIPKLEWFLPSLVIFLEKIPKLEWFYHLWWFFPFSPWFPSIFSQSEESFAQNMSVIKKNVDHLEARLKGSK